MLHCHCFSALF